MNERPNERNETERTSERNERGNERKKHVTERNERGPTGPPAGGILEQTNETNEIMEKRWIGRTDRRTNERSHERNETKWNETKRNRSNKDLPARPSPQIETRNHCNRWIKTTWWTSTWMTCLCTDRSGRWCKQARPSKRRPESTSRRGALMCTCIILLIVLDIVSKNYK